MDVVIWTHLLDCLKYQPLSNYLWSYSRCFFINLPHDVFPGDFVGHQLDLGETALLAETSSLGRMVFGIGRQHGEALALVASKTLYNLPSKLPRIQFCEL